MLERLNIRRFFFKKLTHNLGTVKRSKKGRDTEGRIARDSRGSKGSLVSRNGTRWTIEDDEEEDIKDWTMQDLSRGTVDTAIGG